MRNLKVLLALVVALLLASSCAENDDDYFPYKMKGLNVWVYDSGQEQGFLAGFVAANYDSRQEGLAGCAALASSAAAARHLEQWSHVCCTVTEKSQCATKVR
jgi:hypothetical protein